MKYFVAIAAIALGAPAAADVVSASANGFEIRESVSLSAPTDVLFRDFGNIGKW